MEGVILTPVSDLTPRVERTLGRAMARLRALIPDAGLHHIGATALPGALTKGDVDVLVRVAPARFTAAVEVLGRHFAVKQPANWTASFASFGDDAGHELPLGIQVVAEGGAEDFFLFLRDHFISHPDALREYDRLKMIHAPDGADAYRRAKAEFLGRILEGREEARDFAGDAPADHEPRGRTHMEDAAGEIGRGVVRRLQDAWNAGDGRAFGEPFAEDADFVDFRGTHHRGREAIAAGHQGIFDTVYRGSRIAYELEQARALGDGVVLAHSLGTLSAPVSAGPMSGEHRAVQSLVLVRRGEGWEIAGFHNTLVMQPPPGGPATGGGA